MEVHEAKPTQMLAARRMEQKKKPFLKKTFTRAMPFVDQIVAGKITEKYFFCIFHVEQFERGQSLKGKSLTESNSVGVNFPGRIYLILQRRTYEKFKYEFDFIFIYCRYFHSLIFVSAPSLTRLVIICLKMSPKMGDFRRSCFPGNYFVSN